MNKEILQKLVRDTVIYIIFILIGIGLFQHDKIIARYKSWQQAHLNQTQKPDAKGWDLAVGDQKKDISEAQDNSTATGSLLTTSDVPAKHNLDIEFHSQAPLKVWDEIHKDMCEESSVLQVINYFEKRSMTNQEFDVELLKMKEAEERIVGEWVSTTVAEVKQFTEAYFPKYRVEIIENITEDQIAQYIASGIPVILPLSGRTIGNPFYTPPGPVYHMLVVKGYTKTHFITNDVGTKQGADFFYKKETIMNNIHDWNPENIFDGAKRGLVVLPR